MHTYVAINIDSCLSVNLVEAFSIENSYDSNSIYIRLLQFPIANWVYIQNEFLDIDISIFYAIPIHPTRFNRSFGLIISEISA